MRAMVYEGLNILNGKSDLAGFGRLLKESWKIKRGLADTSEPGAFTKSAVYFRGERAIAKFAASGGDLTRLYVGKVTLDDLELIEQVPGLQPPLLLPTFLREEMTK